LQRYNDLPVAVDLPDAVSAEVIPFVEAEAGWQVVDEDGPLAPVLKLATTAGPARCPVVVVAAGTPNPDAVRAALLEGALDVIAWPAERERLVRAPARVSSAAPAPTVAPLRIGGCRGGVGTSTVALSVGGTVAWSGGRALVVGDDDLLRLAGVAWEGPGAAEVSALGGDGAGEVAGVARPVPGVPGLDVLRGDGTITDVGGWPYDLVVVDAGTRQAGGLTLQVGAADRSLSNAAAQVPLLVVELGPLDRAGVRRHLGGPPAGWLPHSARVARAGAAGRVPSGLPGSWVAALRRCLRSVA